MSEEIKNPIESEIKTTENENKIQENEKTIQENEPPRKKRGRPKKATIDKSNVEPTEGSEEDKPKQDLKSVDSEIDDLLKDYSSVETQININSTPETIEPPKKKRGRPKGSAKKKEFEPSDSFFLSGKMLLSFINIFFPSAILFIGGMFDERFKRMDSDEIKLNQSEKRELEELAEEVANRLFSEANPMVLFSIGLFTMYGTKVMGTLATMPKVKKK